MFRFSDVSVVAATGNGLRIVPDASAATSRARLLYE
jgi:hypothetical protein